MAKRVSRAARPKWIDLITHRWVVAGIKLLAATIVGLLGIYWLIFKNPVFELRRIISTKPLPKELNMRLYGCNIFSFSLAELYSKLQRAFPLAKSVRLMKVLPETLRIEIVERKPVLFIRRQGVIYPVDEEGVVLSPTESLPRDVLEVRLDPELSLTQGKVLESESLFSALELVRALKETGLLELFDFEYIDALQPYELRLKIHKGPVWKLRGGRYKEKLEIFKEKLLNTFLEDLPHMGEDSYLLFLDDGTITVNP